MNQSTFWTAKTGQENEGSRKRSLNDDQVLPDEPGEELYTLSQNGLGNSTVDQYTWRAASFHTSKRCDYALSIRFTGLETHATPVTATGIAPLVENT